MANRAARRRRRSMESGCTASRPRWNRRPRRSRPSWRDRIRGRRWCWRLAGEDAAGGFAQWNVFGVELDAAAHRASRAPPRRYAGGEPLHTDVGGMVGCGHGAIQNAEFRMPRNCQTAAFDRLHSALLNLIQNYRRALIASARMLPPPKLIRSGMSPPVVTFTAQYLNSGNLAEGIEHRVGQHVRRRLVVAERHEHGRAACRRRRARRARCCRGARRW